MTWHEFALSFALTVATACAPLSSGEASGPWKAQIVNAENGQPLEGVVVLAYWIKYEASVGGWAAGKHYDSEEVVTGPDGRFVIGSRWAYTIPGIRKVSGPEWVIFKPGFGQWRIWNRLEGFGQGEESTIELPLLRTREERLKFHIVGPAPVVPPDRMRRLTEALKREDEFLFGRGR